MSGHIPFFKKGMQLFSFTYSHIYLRKPSDFGFPRFLPFGTGYGLSDLGSYSKLADSRQKPRRKICQIARLYRDICIVSPAKRLYDLVGLRICKNRTPRGAFKRGKRDDANYHLSVTCLPNPLAADTEGATYVKTAVKQRIGIDAAPKLFSFGWKNRRKPDDLREVEIGHALKKDRSNSKDTVPSATMVKNCSAPTTYLKEAQTDPSNCQLMTDGFSVRTARMGCGSTLGLCQVRVSLVRNERVKAAAFQDLYSAGSDLIDRTARLRIWGAIRQRVRGSKNAKITMKTVVSVCSKISDGSIRKSETSMRMGKGNVVFSSKNTTSTKSITSKPVALLIGNLYKSLAAEMRESWSKSNRPDMGRTYNLYGNIQVIFCNTGFENELVTHLIQTYRHGTITKFGNDPERDLSSLICKKTTPLSITTAAPMKNSQNVKTLLSEKTTKKPANLIGKKAKKWFSILLSSDSEINRAICLQKISRCAVKGHFAKIRPTTERLYLPYRTERRSRQ